MAKGNKNVDASVQEVQVVEKTIRMSVKDRLLLVNLLPTNGTIKEILRWKKLERLVHLSEKEREAINLRQTEEGQLVWDGEHAVDKNIDFVQDQLDILIDLIDNSTQVVATSSVPTFMVDEF